MKRKNFSKKLLALGMSATMILGMVACGNEATVSSSESTGVAESSESAASSEEVVEKEPVTLEYYFRGFGVQEDTQKVEDRVNELLKDYPGLEHVTVHIHPYAKADYLTQVALAQTTGGQIDILNSVSLNFAQHVEDGSWMPLNDLISDELKAELPEWLWELGSVDGNIYIVPNYQNAFNEGFLLFPKEYMDKYGNYDKMYATLTDWDLSITEKAECLEEFIAAVREGEGNTKYGSMIGQHFTGSTGFYFTTPYDHLNSNFVVMDDGEHQVEYLYATEEMKEVWSVYADWNQKGLYAPDGVTTQTDNYNGKNMLNDISTVFTAKEQVGDPEYVADIYSAAYGFEVVAIPVQEYRYVQNSWGAGGNGVSSTCENPEEAILFIEALNTGTEIGKEIYNTLTFGIEGEHYTVDEKDSNRITTLEYDGSQGNGEASYAGMKWVIGNSFYAYKNQAVMDGQFENIKKYNEDSGTQASEHNGFVVSSENISTELEQITAVYTEYKDTFITGVAGADFEKIYGEYIAKLEKAGLKKVIDEYQKQLDDWLVRNGK